MARTRTKTSTFINGGTATTHNPAAGVHNVSTQSQNIIRTSDVCSDSTGSGTDHALQIDHVDKSMCTPLNGRINGTGGSYKEYSNWYPDSVLASLSHLSTSTTSEATDITKALAMSNPSRPVVSIPNFVFELKDLPGMYKEILGFKTQIYNLRNFDRYNPKVAANWLLSIKFGWIPLLNDIKRMLTFQQSVDRRIQELNRLYSNGGLKRRIRTGLGSANAESTTTIFADTTLSALVTCRLQRNTSVERWATVRWKPTARPTASTPADMEKLARRLVFGLNDLSATQVWNAVPWSWLVDWFANVGDFLEANHNSIPTAASPVNLMTESKTTFNWTRTDSFNEWKGADGSATLHTKKRTIGNASLTASLPFLSGGQLSILGALALQRMR